MHSYLIPLPVAPPIAAPTCARRHAPVSANQGRVVDALVPNPLGGEVSNAPFGNGNTFPQVYDALGRYLFAGVTVDF